MIAPLVALFLQTTPPPTPRPVAGQEDKPVHVWLDSMNPLARGSAVRVYVQVAADGNLVVLQRRTDGRIDVLFPSSPAGTPFIRAGTYEIRGPGDRPAFVVAEPDGTGMILAALATDVPRFNEFVRAADWNPDALVPSWGGTDAEGALTDIVQRMLGDGTFNYDFVTYTVAPAVYAEQASLAGPVPHLTCVGCTFIGTEIVIAVPFFGCDAFFGVCFGFPHLRHRAERPPPVEDRPRVLALNLRPRAGPPAVARRREVPIPHRDRPASSAMTAPLRHVRFTRLSNPSTSADVARGSVVAVSHGAVLPAGRARVPTAARPRTATWVVGKAVGGAVATAPRARLTTSASATTHGTRTLALPRAQWPVGGGRAGVAHAGVARH